MVDFYKEVIKHIDKMSFFIITQVKNQESRIYQWMKYHMKEGFSSFIIFDDFSEDKTMEEINRFKSDFPNVSIITQNTDGIGGSYDRESCKNSDSYGGDMSLHNRLNRSYNRGNEIAKSLDIDPICAVIDVDEFLYTDSNIKVCDVISDIFLEQDCHQIRVINFDIKDNYTLSKTFLTENIFSIWNEDELDNNVVLRTRAKCIVRSKFIKGITFVHDILNGQFPRTLSDKSYEERNYSRLKMLHFRKPNLSSYNGNLITFKEDEKINQKFKSL